MCEKCRKTIKKRLKCINFWFAHAHLKILRKIRKILNGRSTMTFRHSAPGNFPTMQSVSRRVCQDRHFHLGEPACSPRFQLFQIPNIVKTFHKKWVSKFDQKSPVHAVPGSSLDIPKDIANHGLNWPRQWPINKKFNSLARFF